MAKAPRGLGITVLALLTSFWIAGTARAECSEHSAYALLIGITDYEPSGERNLEGPANDVALMKDVLLRRFAIPARNVISLTNQQATHIGIQKAFADLAARASACDFVYIHYSGHGAQFDNKDRAQKCDNEELDQTWVSYGARSNTYAGDQALNNADVLDDEINDWLARLNTDNYVFVSDSCHSGTAFRGEVDGVRSASDYKGKSPIAEAALRCEGDPRGIKIGAARDIEEAIEIRPRLGNGEKKAYGRFTWYWANALEKALPSETWSDVFGRAYTLVTTDEGSRKQFPQLTGNADRSLFGGRFQEPERTVQVVDVADDGRTVTLGAGAASNVTEGSEFSLFRRGEPATPDRPSLRVVKVDAATSSATVLQGSFSKGDAVSETKHAYLFQPYRLFVDPSCGGAQTGLGTRGQDRPLFDLLRGSLGALEGFEIAKTSDSADMLVCVLRPRKSDGGYIKNATNAPLPEYFADADPEVWVVDQGLQPIHQRLKLSLRHPSEAVAKLGQNLKAYLRGQEVIRFGLNERPGQRPDIRLYVRLLRKTPAANCTDAQPCRTLPIAGMEDNRYRTVSEVELDKLSALRPEGRDILEFRVDNQSSAGLYVYVLNVSKNLAVDVIYPNPELDARAEYAKVKPGEDRLLDYALWELESGDDDWLKFIASRSPVDVNVFVRAGLAEYQASRGLTSTPSALEDLLGAALHTRGSKLTPTVVQNWFVEQNKLIVK